MVARIESLTEEQKAQVKPWADRWLAIGLSTQPADRTRFVAAARTLYKHAGEPRPETFTWVRSPLEGAILVSAIRDGKRNDDTLALIQVMLDGGEPATNILKRLGITDPKFGGQLGGQYGVGGWWGAPAFTTFFLDVCGLEVAPDLEARARAYADTCASACWWWPLDGEVVVSERPHTMKVEKVGADETYRYHCEDGPAVAWEGWAMWSIEGVRVAQHVVEDPSKITVDEIRNEANAERRRIMITRYGAADYLAAVDAKLLDYDKGLGLAGSAPRALIVDDRGDKWLVVSDGGTGRPYHLPVPGVVVTCAEAHSAIAGFDEKLLQGEC